MSIDSTSVKNFYKFEDRRATQVDYGLASVNWIVNQERAHLDEEFISASRYLDDSIDTAGAHTDPITVEELLSVHYPSEQRGPELTFPRAALKDAREFTVEFWVVLRQFAAGNFSVVGMSDRDWDQGFSVAGYMTSDKAIISCLLDTGLESTMEPPCYARTQLCMALSLTGAWQHVSCSRVAFDKTELIIDDDQKTFERNNPIAIEHTIESMFSTGNLIIGTKEGAGFNGYIRELRFWTEALSKDAIDLVKHRRLEPLAHRSLIGYWPLLDGRISNFAEISRCSLQDVVLDTSNEESAKAYGEKAHNWVRVPEYWKLPICPKGTFYYALNNSCVLHRSHAALYFGETGEGEMEMKFEDFVDPDVTVAVWLYHTSDNKVGTVVSIEGFVDVRWVSDASGFRISAKQGDGSPCESTPYQAKMGQWVYYAVAADTQSGKMLFFYEKMKETLGFTPVNIAIASPIKLVIGKSLHAYMRELKVWNAHLTESQIQENKY